MRSLVLLILATFVSSPGGLLAGTIELPGLQGAYTGADSPRSVSIDTGGPIEDLSTVSLELHGMFDTSWTSEGGIPVTWCAEFAATFFDADPGFWMAVLISDGHEGEFHATIEFSSLFGASWAFLADGEGELTFEFEPCAVVGEPQDQDWSLGPFGAIYSATLNLDGTVAGESLSFSRIKALYRQVGP